MSWGSWRAAVIVLYCKILQSLSYINKWWVSTENFSPYGSINTTVAGASLGPQLWPALISRDALHEESLSHRGPCTYFWCFSWMISVFPSLKADLNSWGCGQLQQEASTPPKGVWGSGAEHRISSIWSVFLLLISLWMLRKVSLVVRDKMSCRRPILISWMFPLRVDECRAVCIPPRHWIFLSLSLAVKCWHALTLYDFGIKDQRLFSDFTLSKRKILLILATS